MPSSIIQEIEAVECKLEAIEKSLAVVKTPPQSVQKSLVTLSATIQRIRRRHFVTNSPPPRPTKQKVDDPALDELNDTLSIVRDRVKGVALHGHAGFYLYGRAGTSKTFTVRTTLQKLGTKFVYQNGHITPIGLFETLSDNRDGIIVLDDVSTVFQQPTARNILLGALGCLPDGSREIRYTNNKGTTRIPFRGGVIAISNLELHGDEVMAALKSRVQTLNYNPSDEQIIALMRSIARRGHAHDAGRMTPRECGLVTDYVVEQARRLEMKPDVRMLVDKAFRDFMLWKSQDSESHWKDLIRSAMEDQLVKLEATARQLVPTKQEEAATELELVKKLTSQFASMDDVIAEFVKQTGKSKRTCQRRIREARFSKDSS